MNDLRETAGVDSGMSLERRMLLGVAGLAGVAAWSSSRAQGGPLNPPSGAVGSTPGPEPRTPVSGSTTPGTASSMFRITQPGSYYLTGNVQGLAGRNGIEIATGGVTLDLMGFSVIGTGAGSYGIVGTGSSATGITVRNGVVRGWAANGVELSGSAKGAVLEGVHAVGNAGVGINVGQGSRVSVCVAQGNVTTGMILGAGSLADGCTLEGNGSDGLFTAAGCGVRGCVARGNDRYGIVLGEGSTAHACSCTGGARGIDTEDGALVVGCSVSRTTGTGLVLGNGCTALDCSSVLNGSAGMVCGSACHVSRCLFRLNQASGCTCGSSALVVDNVSLDNAQGGSGSGVQVTSDGRVEGNTCRGNRFGIAATGAGNVVARNVCGGNVTNWSIVANNYVAPIVVCPESVSISGDTGGAGLGTTNAHANFTV